MFSITLQRPSVTGIIADTGDREASDMQNNMALQPVSAGERINALDIIRGFALLGIGLMNIEFFSRPLQDIVESGIDPAMHGLDYAADALVYFFIQSKFWTLFALLFGMGFAVMIERASRAARPLVAVYLRRSLALLAIGLVHAVLVWAGDILVLYALGALMLLAARQLRRTLWRRIDNAEPTPMAASRLARWGAGLYLVPVVMMLVAGMLGSFGGQQPADPNKVAADAQALTDYAAQRMQAQNTYHQGSYEQVVGQRWDDTIHQLNDLPVFSFLLLGMFGLGAAVIRSGWIQDIHAHAHRFRAFRNIGLPLGLMLMALSVSLGTAMPRGGTYSLPMALQLSSYLLAGVVLALSYAATLITMLETRVGPVLQAWLAPAGRMALTNYLTQSLVFTWVFYGYGLGLWGQVGRAEQMVLVLLVYGLQLLVSRCWLAHFCFGPMEWLWRAATYLQWPPIWRDAGT